MFLRNYAFGIYVYVYMVDSIKILTLIKKKRYLNNNYKINIISYYYYQKISLKQKNKFTRQVADLKVIMSMIVR